MGVTEEEASEASGILDQGVNLFPDTHWATLLKPLLSLSLSFLICIMGIISVPTSQDCCKVTMR